MDARRTQGNLYQWEARVVVGRKPDGTPDQQSLRFMTKREAQKEAAKLEAEVAQGTGGRDSKMLLSAYMTEWLTRSERRVRPITMAGYRWRRYEVSAEALNLFDSKADDIAYYYTSRLPDALLTWTVRVMGIVLIGVAVWSGVELLKYLHAHGK